MRPIGAGYRPMPKEFVARPTGSISNCPGVLSKRVNRRVRRERGDSVMFVYGGGVLEEATLNRVAPTVEGRGVVLVDPLRLDEVTIPRLAGRIRHAMAAREIGRVVEAVNGEAR